MGNLKFDGDIIERSFADRIHEVLPAYEKIWLNYIGNNGQAQPLPMPGGNQEVEKSREKYWQRLYTMLESIAMCWGTEEELHQTEEIKSVKAYTKYLNQWMVFYAHIGRIHDMVKNIAGELRRPDLLRPFDDYWHERNIVLHGPKVPMKFVYNVLSVPSFGESPRDWNDKMVWGQLGLSDFNFIADGVSSILRGLEPKLERCFAELYKILPDAFGWRPVEWPTATAEKGALFVRGDFSASVEMHASGNGLFSGTGGIPGSRDG